MQFLGKLIGVALGFMFGGPSGAILGGIIGHFVDKKRHSGANMFQRDFHFTFSQQKPKQHEDFFKAAFSVMGHLAKAKGRVVQQDIELATVMMQRMNLHGKQRREAQQAFREGKDPHFPLEETLARVRTATRGRYATNARFDADLLTFFLELQISAAFADGHLHPSERVMLYTIGRHLGFSALELDQRLRMAEAAARFQQGYAQSEQRTQQDQQRGRDQRSWQRAPSSSQHLEAAYALLGVKRGDDSKSIKRAYRKLMNEHHPDKLSAKGLPPEMINMAKEKSQEIQSAYDLIKKHGFH